MTHSMTGTFIVVAALLAGCVVAPVCSAATYMAAELRSSCEARDLTPESVEITCEISENVPLRRLWLVVKFAGGHDDTSASMTMQLDGSPLQCEPGSKLALFGEDGEVSLRCLIPAGRGAERTRDVRASVNWRHAQFVGQELTSD